MSEIEPDAYPREITQEEDVECFILSMPPDLVSLMVEIVKRIDG